MPADGIVLHCAGPLALDLSTQIAAVLYAPLRALGGSFSAEHGVGYKRMGAMFDSLDPVKLLTMAHIKHMLDPCNRPNPGKVLRAP